MKKRNSGSGGSQPAASKRQPTGGQNHPQQRGQWDPQHQQRGRGGQGQQCDSQSKPSQQKQHRPGPNVRQGGREQNWRQQGGQQRQKLNEQRPQQLPNSDEPVLPFKATSCAGILRGTLGTPGIVEVNYVKLNWDNMPREVYHYDVTITPDRPKKYLRSAFEMCKHEKFVDIEAAFDGKKSCYSVQRLPTPIDNTVSVADVNDRMREFRIEIKETADCVIDMDLLRRYHKKKVSDKPMRQLQVLDVALSGNNHQRKIRVGRSFFIRPAKPHNLGDGFEVWTGLFQAPILGEQPFLNVDIIYKPFPRPCSLLQYLDDQKINPNNTLYGYKRKSLQGFLKGLDIQYDPPGNFGVTPKRYKVLDVGDSALEIKFKTDEGQQMAVSQHFKQRGYTLKYPKLNCVKVGSTVRPLCLPMELCSIPPGQVLNRKTGKRQVENLIQFAATSTNVRKEKIMNILQDFRLNECPIIRAFGVEIESNFIRVPMRVLPASFIEYLNGKTVFTTLGAWRMDGAKFLNSSKTPNGHKWAILYENLDQNNGFRHNLETFKNNVFKTSGSLGVNLASEANIIAYDNSQQLLNKFCDLAKNNIALVFVVLRDGGRTGYHQVKQTADLKVGILTQCITEDVLYKAVDMSGKGKTIISNIFLKINAKLNGTNHKIAQETEENLLELMSPIANAMYLGADVTHPSPDQRYIPSVVASAASHDQFGACYNMQYRLQKSKQEYIEDMESMITEHLKMFHKCQDHYPEQIFYYRDGVSDGQFPVITDKEVPAIRRACSKLSIKPKVTCVIVIKRHHTRFFPMTTPKDRKDLNNVEPGTVVDQHITHPNEKQFFMVSHRSIQGTARPARYNIIEDDSKFDINLLQKLSYNLCHLFPRCNSAVSYPAPVYLAHLAAFRGRVYLEGPCKITKDYNKEYEKRLIKMQLVNGNPMFFV